MEEGENGKRKNEMHIIEQTTGEYDIVGCPNKKTKIQQHTNKTKHIAYRGHREPLAKVN